MAEEEAIHVCVEYNSDSGAAQMFGDAAEKIEQLIICVAQETSGFADVGRAGLSPIQWPALLHALIWQESRFTIYARSPVGAFGLNSLGVSPRAISPRNSAFRLP